MVSLKQIRKNLKRNKKGTLTGMLFGLIIVIIMKFQGNVTQAAVSNGGLIEKVITLPVADMALLKLVITAVILGGILGYSIQEFMRK